MVSELTRAVSSSSQIKHTGFSLFSRNYISKIYGQDKNKDKITL